MTTSLERMLEIAGVPAVKKLDEARTVPLTRGELSPKDEKNLSAKAKHLTNARNHLVSAVKALENIPSTDFMGDVPHFINEIETVIKGDSSGAGGIDELLKIYEREHHTTVKARLKDGDIKSKNLVQQFRLGEAEEDSDNLLKLATKGVNAVVEEISTLLDKAETEDQKEVYKKDLVLYKKLAEALKDKDVKKAKTVYVDMKENQQNYIYKGIVKDKEQLAALNEVLDRKSLNEEDDFNYHDVYYSFDDDNANPLNVRHLTTKDSQDVANAFYSASGVGNLVDDNETIWDKNPDDQGESDDGTGTQRMEDNRPIKVPQKVLVTLKVCIDKLRDGMSDVYGYDPYLADQYMDAAREFDILYDCLSKQTVHSMKLSQVYMNTLRGTLIQMLPELVYDFISRGGEVFKLKDYVLNAKQKENM